MARAARCATASASTFEGFTYGERFMIIGTPYDFAQAGYAFRNYISDPVEWYNLFKISWKGPPGVYRLVVPVSLDEALDDGTNPGNVSAQVSALSPAIGTLRDRPP